MWLKFKWDMFITSFIPLWVSIFIVDLWNVIKKIILIWDSCQSFGKNIGNCMFENLLLLISIFVVLIIVIMSVFGINSFLKRLNQHNSFPEGKIIKARKENKLSSEFLLAYILPMIAFDFCNPQDLVLFVIYFLVLAFLCIRNNNIYTNIMLEFKGYKMYNCDIECGVANDTHIYRDSIIISSEDLTLEKLNKVKYWDFENYIYITVKGRNDS